MLFDLKDRVVSVGDEELREHGLSAGENQMKAKLEAPYP